MKLSAIVAVIVVMLACVDPDSVKAQGIDNDGRNNLGVGVLLGEPTGVTVKYWNSARSAVDIGAAWSLTDRDEALHLHSDYLLHSWFANDDNLAFYYGIGARIIFADESSAGLRIPVGLNLLFETIPFDIFVEAAPIIDLTPDVEFAGNGGVGIRYYF